MINVIDLNTTTIVATLVKEEAETIATVTQMIRAGFGINISPESNFEENALNEVNQFDYTSSFVPMGGSLTIN